MRGFGLVVWFALVVIIWCPASPSHGGHHGSSTAFQQQIYDPGELKPRDSTLKVKIGDRAPDFRLPSVSGTGISLSQFQGDKNVVLSFVPAAWTPVCSDQWPGYNIARGVFERLDTIILGITVDNIPTLFAWTQQMTPDQSDLWFPVLSDFWPHGAVAARYGVLRSDGVSERALIIIDKAGIIRYIDVHDINARPPLGVLVDALEQLEE